MKIKWLRTFDLEPGLTIEHPATRLPALHIEAGQVQEVIRVLNIEANPGKCLIVTEEYPDGTSDLLNAISKNDFEIIE